MRPAPRCPVRPSRSRARKALSARTSKPSATNAVPINSCGLQAGTYIVKGELAGFRPFEMRDILVNANATARADLRLDIGSIAEGADGHR